jgi:hypothetical protein
MTIIRAEMLCFWTLFIALSLSKTVPFIFQNITFQKLDSVSIFRWNLLTWAQSIERLPISGRFGYEVGSETDHQSAPETYSYRSLSHFKFNHSHHVKRGVIHSLVKRAKIMSKTEGF